MPGVLVDNLVARSGDLKGELLAFVYTDPQLTKMLTARLESAAQQHGELDETQTVLITDYFALQEPLPDGNTVVEQFVAQHQPPLPDDEREMLLGWRDVVEGCFEIDRFEHGGVLLHNLVDDLVYQVFSNLGRKTFADLRKGMFVLGRIVPVHPDTDAWLVSGHLSTFRKSAAPEIAQTALDILGSNPELLHRNPELLRRAWALQAEDRADFVELFGTDLVALPPQEAQQKLREHYRHRVSKAAAASGIEYDEASADELVTLPEELMGAESVALVYDEVEGLNYFRDFDRLDALFADPSLAAQDAYLARLRGYLNDGAISPLAIRRLAQRHPDGADQVFQTLLGKPDFSWPRDGEALLRRHKSAYLDGEPAPSLAAIGDRLNELLGSAQQ
jgi:hypothetical protein